MIDKWYCRFLKYMDFQKKIYGYIGYDKLFVLSENFSIWLEPITSMWFKWITSPELFIELTPNDMFSYIWTETCQVLYKTESSQNLCGLDKRYWTQHCLRHFSFLKLHYCCHVNIHYSSIRLRQCYYNVRYFFVIER